MNKIIPTIEIENDEVHYYTNSSYNREIEISNLINPSVFPQLSEEITKENLILNLIYNSDIINDEKNLNFKELSKKIEELKSKIVKEGYNEKILEYTSMNIIDEYNLSYKVLINKYLPVTSFLSLMEKRFTNIESSKLYKYRVELNNLRENYLEKQNELNDCTDKVFVEKQLKKEKEIINNFKKENKDFAAAEKIKEDLLTKYAKIIGRLDLLEKSKVQIADKKSKKFKY